MKITNVSSEELNSRLDTPYNPPIFSVSFTEYMFKKEWLAIRDSLKMELDKFGRWEAYGQGDYFLDDILTFSRGIPVEITNPTMITADLIGTLQTFLQSLQHCYEINLALTVDGNFYDMFISREGLITDCPESVTTCFFNH